MSEYKFMDKSLSIDERVEALLRELTLEEKLGMLCTYQPEVARLGLRGFGIGAEVARGLVCRGSTEEPTTVFPEPFGLAATFDPEIMHKMGEITGIESRIYHKRGKTSLCVWGPTVDAERDPRWGRTEEAYGEDPYLIGEMSREYTLGMAGDDPENLRVLPMLKHFYANNNEEDRGSDNASIPIGLKHDYYLKAFETAMREGGARGVMAAYNEINGVEGLCNSELGDLLKKDWGMLFSVTDGGDFVMNVLSHKSDESFTETAARVYKSHGADIMTDSPVVVKKAVKKALEQGLLEESDLDSALFGVFKARFLLGEIYGDSPHDSYSDELLCCDEFYKAAERAAVESVILLKNDSGVLPFDKSKTTAVIGIHADMNFRDWYTGMSDRCDTFKGTILDSILKTCGKGNVLYDSGNDLIALRDPKSGLYLSRNEDGSLSPKSRKIDDSCTFELYDWGDGAISLRSCAAERKFLTDDGLAKFTADNVFGWYVHEMFYLGEAEGGVTLKSWQKKYLALNEGGLLAASSDPRPDGSFVFELEVVSSGLERAAKLAKKADQAVLFAGNHPLINAREGFDRKHLELPESVQALLSEMIDANEHTALFMVSGYPYALHEPYLTAAMHVCHAGPALGAAVTKTLFGEVSPAGRCPMTWYKSADELRDIKDYNIIRTKSTYLYYTGKPLFPFGHGLSYTKFRYSEPAVRLDGEAIRISIDVTNLTDTPSDEVVQAYISAPRFGAFVPLKQLKAFRRVHIDGRQTSAVDMKIDLKKLGFWNGQESREVVYGGRYTVLIGASSEDIRATVSLDIPGEEYRGIDVSKPVEGAMSYDYFMAEFDTDKEHNEYVKIADWQSYVSYHDCDMRGYNKIEVEAAAIGGGARLNFSCAENGQFVASIEVPGSDGYEGFTKITADAQPVEGRFTLRVTGGGYLKSFRFYNTNF